MDNLKDEETKEQTFMEFIEKLVILDVILEPVITRYFVKYRSFPFMCEETLGGKENIGKIFIIWMHYYKIYFGHLSEKVLEDKQKEEIRDQYMERFDDPTDYT